MNNQAPIYLFVLGMLVCGGLSVLLLVGGAYLIYFLGRSVGKPMIQKQIEDIVDDWAEEHGYEVLEISDVKSRDHPFADRFGFGLHVTPGIVKRIKVRDRKDRLRRGWIFLKARYAGQGYSGFLPDSLEVEWDD